MNHKEKLARKNELEVAIKRNPKYNDEEEYKSLVTDIFGLTESEALISLASIKKSRKHI